MKDHTWRDEAACHDGWTDDFFPDEHGPMERYVINKFCDNCDVRTACLEFAMQTEGDVTERNRYGIYGGMTPRARAKLAQRLRKVGA